LIVSEQMTELTSSETGSVGAEPAVPKSDARSEPVAAAAGQPGEVSSPKPAPEQAEAFDAPKVEQQKTDASNQDAPSKPGKVVIMPPGDRAWERGPEIKSEAGSAKRRLAALAAVAVLAAATGALGGALATAGLGHFTGDDAASGNRAIEAALVRIDADISNLKVSLEHTSKVGMTQFNKTSERLDKVEKAQSEPAAKLARLSEAVDKLRAVPVASAAIAATPVAAKEVTGSIAPGATAASKSEVAKSEVAKSEVGKSEAAKNEATRPEAPKTEIARLPTVEGWVLRDVDRGSALIEGRRGVFEVYAGDPVPGLGRVDAIRRQDGRWVVVTSKGLIVAR
jgi:hypothetical protein